MSADKALPSDYSPIKIPSPLTDHYCILSTRLPRALPSNPTPTPADEFFLFPIPRCIHLEYRKCNQYSKDLSQLSCFPPTSYAVWKAQHCFKHSFYNISSFLGFLGIFQKDGEEGPEEGGMKRGRGTLGSRLGILFLAHLSKF